MSTRATRSHPYWSHDVVQGQFAGRGPEVEVNKHPGVQLLVRTRQERFCRLNTSVIEIYNFGLHIWSSDDHTRRHVTKRGETVSTRGGLACAHQVGEGGACVRYERYFPVTLVL